MLYLSFRLSPPVPAFEDVEDFHEEVGLYGCLGERRVGAYCVCSFEHQGLCARGRAMAAASTNRFFITIFDRGEFLLNVVF